MAMTKDDYKHFVCIAAGDNPKKLMAEYDLNKKVDFYTVFKYEDAAKIKQKYIESYQSIVDDDSISELQREYAQNTIEDLKEMSNDEFFDEISEEYTINAKTGDAMSDKNPKGKWTSYQQGKIFSIPFLTMDGREVFQDRKGDINWDMIHLHGGEVYERAWEMVMEGSEPQSEDERNVYENMKEMTTYFKKFETKENYVTSNTAFWGYAFVSEKTGWQDARDCADQFVWMSNFYDMFIKNLPDDTLLTIYECIK